jgi:hypothetical protein
MRVLVSLFFCSLLMFGLCQQHYVPAQILIPTLNASIVHSLHNATLNRPDVTNHTGWNNPRLNKTIEGTPNGTNSNGDLIVGHISAMDHRLFRQVSWVGVEILNFTFGVGLHENETVVVWTGEDRGVPQRSARELRTPRDHLGGEGF